MNENEKEHILEGYYFKASNPAAYAGAKKLFQVLNKKYPGLFTITYIKQWVNDQDAYSLQKQRRHIFKTANVRVAAIVNMNENEKEQILEGYYFKASNPAAYVGAKKLFQVLNKKYPGLFTITYIKQLLNDQDAYSLQKQRRHRFKTANVRVAAIDCDLTCLGCPDSPVARDCQYVARCGSHESCYLDSYVTKAGTTINAMGCRDTAMCTSHNGKRSANMTIAKRSAGNLLVCSDCCHGDLCNSALCGQPGYPTVAGKRGPLCYNCDQQIKPGACNVITECAREEVCSLLAFKSPVVPDDVLYTTGCKSRHTCEAVLGALRQTNNIIGRKRYNDQAYSVAGHGCLGQCCDQDLCATNCTACKDPSYTLMDNAGMCLKVSTANLTYSDARNSCKRDGGDLVTVKSQAVLDAVAQVTLNNAATSYWIGLQREAPMSPHFLWVDGSRLTAYNGGQFWEPGQPNNLNSDQDCAMLLRRSGKTLHLADYYCRRPLLFICEMKL